MFFIVVHSMLCMSLFINILLSKSKYQQRREKKEKRRVKKIMRRRRVKKIMRRTKVKVRIIQKVAIFIVIFCLV